MIVDILFAVCVGYGFYLGFKNEPLNRIFNFLPFLIGFLVGIYLGPILYDKLAGLWGSDGVWIFVLSFILCAFVGWSFSKYLAEMFLKAAKNMKIKKPEKLLNGITVSFLLSIVFSGLISFFNKAEIISPKLKETSISLALLESLPIKLKASMKRMQPGFREFYEKSNTVINKESDDKK
jgi:MFS family permease